MALQKKTTITTGYGLLGDGSSGNAIRLDASTLTAATAGSLPVGTTVLVSGSTGQRATMAQVVTAGLGALPAGAQGVLGGSGAGNTYIAADGTARLLPAASGGSATPLATSAPPADAITTGVVGTSANAARQDHAHPFAHSLVLTQAGGLVYTHNGDAKTVAIPSGTVAQVIGFDASGNPARATMPSGGSSTPLAISAGVQGDGSSSNPIKSKLSTLPVSASGALPTNTLIPVSGGDGQLATASQIIALGLQEFPAFGPAAFGGNTGGSFYLAADNTLRKLPFLASVAPPADAITTGAVGISGAPAREDHAHPFTHSLTLTQAGGLVYTHNGDAKTVAIPAGTVAQVVGFDASGAPARASMPASLPTSATSGQVLTSSGAGVAPVWSAPLAVLKTGLPINAEIFQSSISYPAFTNHVEVRGTVQSWTNTDATRSAYFQFHVGTQGGVDTGANASWVTKINVYAKIGSAPSLVNPDLGSNPDVIENGEFQHYSGFSTGSRVMQSRAGTLQTMIVAPGQTLYYQVGHDYYVDSGSITIVYMYTGISPRMVFLVP